MVVMAIMVIILPYLYEMKFKYNKSHWNKKVSMASLILTIFLCSSAVVFTSDFIY